MTELLLALVEDAVFSAIAAVGFAMAFNVPPKILPLCALAGAIAHSLRTALIFMGWGIEWSSLVAASLVGLIGVYWSRKYIVPRPVFAIASVIPLFPGTYAFKTFIGLFSIHKLGYSIEMMSMVVENGLSTLFILMALCFGLALPSIVIYRFRPIV
ncbi:threonine/serine exporter family protein [Thalassotalea sp. LPB0316]|uniref:threonine/serine exporter family protein n=1 Tax=Thalassotalea sp. LPB0316 TaxID=2769490 RepID=UPI0018692357|nr:threonine/serine exporter family protein [Thalassotalea sp. LPB0316]QOL25408.1 threonine/serine exporter family protein [Thalassotalea sp. LPB0316]